MVIDSSALVAMIFAEPGFEALAETITQAEVRFMSAASVLEAALVICGRLGPEGSAKLDDTLSASLVNIRPFDREQLTAARAAWLTYGKGRHKARLNFGDCIAYALAKTSNEPLLYKGNDFALTDIRSAI